MNGVRSRTVLITGAAKRVGAAIARRLAADGWNVIVHYHQSEREAAELAAEIGRAGGTCDLVGADLASRPDVEGLMERCVALHGSVECLINNASRFYYDDISSVTWESLHDHLASNLIAPIFLCRDFARSFDALSRHPRARPGDHHQRHGAAIDPRVKPGDDGEEPDAPAADACIINILDQKVTNLNPDFLSYTIGKIGLSGLTTTLAMALAGRIRVCGIAPGLTLISGKQTEASFAKAWRAPPLMRSTTPDEIASCVQYILASPSMTGNTIFLDGGESLAGRARDIAFDVSV